MGIQIEEILELGVDEKLRIVGEYGIVLPISRPISGEERKELDKRLLEYRGTPNEGIEWTELKNKLS